MTETWLITGGSGSFGTAFIRTVLAERPDVQLVSVSRNAEMRYRLEALAPRDRLVVIPGDVRRADEMALAFQCRPSVVIHAAAEKHIGTGEAYRAYVDSVNTHGTQVVLTEAVRAAVGRFLFLSTDKACAPIANAYGRSKAAAEARVVRVEQMKASVVRYGNVVASSGSVIPLFLKQRASGVLTVTDRRMTRYWMPLAEAGYCDVPVYQEPHNQPVMSAVRWVLTCLEHMQGGEVFVPKIPSASVQQLAEAIGPDCEIREIGMRDGEKLAEDLISEEEGSRCWRVPFGGWAILPTSETEGQAGWVREPMPFQYRSDQGLLPVRVEEAVSR
jgi:UDP-N-acetylglucosamine 4,6-dehydratase